MRHLHTHAHVRALGVGDRQGAQWARRGRGRVSRRVWPRSRPRQVPRSRARASMNAASPVRVRVHAGRAWSWGPGPHPALPHCPTSDVRASTPTPPPPPSSLLVFLVHTKVQRWGRIRARVRCGTARAGGRTYSFSWRTRCTRGSPGAARTSCRAWRSAGLTGRRARRGRRQVAVAERTVEQRCSPTESKLGRSGGGGGGWGAGKAQSKEAKRQSDGETATRRRDRERRTDSPREPVPHTHESRRGERESGAVSRARTKGEGGGGSRAATPGPIYPARRTRTGAGWASS